MAKSLASFELTVQHITDEVFLLLHRLGSH